MLLAAALLAAAPTSPARAHVDPRSVLRPDAVARYDSIKTTVAKHGWTCVYVEPSASTVTAGYAYTVGLGAKKLPEVLFITPENGEVACAMITAIATRLIRRALPVADGYEPLPTHKVHLHIIPPKQFFDVCTFAGVWALDHGTLRATQTVEVIVSTPSG
jgi:hypothetical protein